MSKRFYFVLLLILSLLPMIDLLKSGLPLTHDGHDHVARIANFYRNLEEGNWIPRWGGNLNWGYGHPILMFLYPLPSYLASLFHVSGFSLVDSTKLVFASTYTISIFTMFLWANAQFGLIPGATGALLYGLAPYRFVDLYVRGAIGEHVAFVFPPLILYGMFRLAKQSSGDERKLWGLVVALSMAGLILSHNAVSLMFLPIVLLYMIYLSVFETNRKFSYLIKTVFYLTLGFAFSAFFWIPAFWEGKYTLRDIVTKESFAGRFVPLIWIFRSAWNYGGGNEFSKSLGYGQWLAVFGSLVVLWKSKDDKRRWLIMASLVLLFASLGLMLAWSEPFWTKVSLMQKFQFPWRLLSLSSFLCAFLAAATVSQFSGRSARLFSLLVISIALISTSFMWKAKTYVSQSEDFYTGIYAGTTDTGESSPIWSVRFMEKSPLAPLEVVSGTAQITPKLHLTTRHEYQVEVAEKSRLAENTLYFPGWRIRVDGKDVPIEFQDPNHRGLMTFWIEPGRQFIEVVFGETKLRLAANLISLASLVIVVLIITIHLCGKIRRFP